MSKQLPSLSFENYYVLFEVQPQFTSKQLKEGYQRLVRIFHPDKNKDVDTTETFQKIKDAYDLLRDENKKAEYDRGIKAKLQRQEKEQKMDKKRTRMKMDLEEKERRAKKRKIEEQQEEYVREYRKTTKQNMSQNERESYNQSLLQKHAQKLRQEQRKESLNYNEDFIVLQWDESKGKYSKDELNSIFSTYGTVGSIALVDSHIALLVYRKDNGAIKLMTSVREGKSLGLPSHRIKASWLDHQKSEQIHFETAPSSATTNSFKNLPKEKIFNTVKYPTLQEHLALEEEVLAMLEKAANHRKN